MAVAEERRAKRRLSTSGVTSQLPALPLPGECPNDGDVALIPEDPSSVRVRIAHIYQLWIIRDSWSPGRLIRDLLTEFPETQRGSEPRCTEALQVGSILIHSFHCIVRASEAELEVRQ